MGRVRYAKCEKTGKVLPIQECSQYQVKQDVNAPNYHSGDWVKGWYEHIDKEPIYIDSKKQLAHECEKRGVYAKALMKPKSQGKGYEHRR